MTFFSKGPPFAILFKKNSIIFQRVPPWNFFSKILVQFWEDLLWYKNSSIDRALCLASFIFLSNFILMWNFPQKTSKNRNELKATGNKAKWQLWFVNGIYRTFHTQNDVESTNIDESRILDIVRTFPRLGACAYDSQINHILGKRNDWTKLLHDKESETQRGLQCTYTYDSPRHGSAPMLKCMHTI